MRQFAKIGLLSMLLYTFVCLLLGIFDKFNLLWVPVMEPSFADLRLVTTASECFQTSAWSMLSASCDPWGRPFNYPSLWVKIFAALGINEVDTPLIGIFEILILCLTFLYWIWRFRLLTAGRGSGLYRLLVSSFLLSPPIFLLMERGNTDILMFAGLTLASELLRKQSIVTAGVLIALLGGLKVYPFAAMVAILASTANLGRRILILAVSALSGLMILGEAFVIANRSSSTFNPTSYGMSIMPLALFSAVDIRESRIAGFLLGLIVLATLTSALKILFTIRIEKAVNFLNENIELKQPFNLFGLVFAFTFLVGTSFDMRLVMLFPLSIIFYLLCETQTERAFILVLMFITMYGGHLAYDLSYFGKSLNLMGDASILLLSSAILLILVQVNWRKWDSKIVKCTTN
jgi:hypothetical protein